MTQKVLRVGTSAAVTIPKKSLKELGLKIGDSISVVVDTKSRRVVIEHPVRVDQEILDWTNGFIKRYRPALEALSRK